MTTNPHTAPTAASHHGRARRLAAVLVIATAAWAGVHSVGTTHTAAPGDLTSEQHTTVVRPEATTDWLARANR